MITPPPYLFLILFILSSPAFTEEDHHEEVFNSIYQQAAWGRNAEGEAFSGGGSLVEVARPYMDFLQNFLKENHIETVVDAGCGDWEFSRHINWDGIDYIGYDVVAYIIEKNKKNFSAPNK